jgi:hypothetical protein
MKKLSFIIVLITVVFWFSASFAAQPCQVTLEQPGEKTRVVVFNCAADAFGAVSDTSTNSTHTSQIQGYVVYEIATKPGATGPTTLYDMTLTDKDGFDLANGELANRSATVAERIYPVRSVNGPLTLAVTNNTVASSRFTVRVFLYKD